MRFSKFLTSLVCIYLLVFVCGFNVHVYAYDIPSKIKVGLEYKYKNVTSVPISNTNILVGYEINGVFTTGAQLNTGSYSVSTSDSYFVRLPQQFSGYDQAASLSSSYAASGYSASVGMVTPYEFYVYLGGYGTQQEASIVSSQIGGTVINSNSRRTVLFSAGRSIIVFDNDSLFPQITASGTDTYVNLGDRKYRGAIEFSRYSGKLTAVNVCGVDEYLLSVVPSEMSSAWHIEALKAQAVASRSYTLTRLTAHQSSGYQLCDAAHCQVYLGASEEREHSNSSVTQTSGVVALYDSKPINAVFFASSGGVTDNSENVWTDTIPYLRSVSDSYETTPKIWTRTFTLSEITNLLNAQEKNIGTAVSITLTNSGVSNRVLEMTIQGTAGSETFKKEAIRNFFNKSTDGALASRNFTISNGVASNPGSGGVQVMDSIFRIQGSSASTDSTISNLYVYTNNVSTQPIGNYINTGSSVSVISKDGIKSVASLSNQGSASTVTGGQNGSVTFNGKGSGHGVGMSQYGAKAMAEAGFGFMDILRYYYSGVYF